jgi:hypothetical protein
MHYSQGKSECYYPPSLSAGFVVSDRKKLRQTMTGAVHATVISQGLRHEVDFENTLSPCFFNEFLSNFQ